MDEQDNLQLELFSQSKNAGVSSGHKQNGYLFSRLWNYEKTILIIIGIVITSIISFSLGVEKGKRLTVLRNEPLPIITTGATNFKETLPKKAPDSTQPLLQENQGFVIQLASYKSKISAQKEVELLQKMGFSPSVKSRGSYSVLYVGNFSNKETAQSKIAELKKRFKDCYIRRL